MTPVKAYQTLPTCRPAVRGVLFGGTLEAAASKLLGLANLIWMVVSNMFYLHPYLGR